MPSTSAARVLLPPSVCSTHMMYARSIASSVGFGGARSATSGSASRCVTRSGSASTLDRVAGREDHGALERVLQLAHVAGPLVLHAAPRAPSRCSALRRLAALRRRCASRKCSASSGMSSRALAQRRQVQRDDVQPVVQIAAEVAAPDLLLEVAVRRRDERACRSGIALRRADRDHFAVLQHAQQLDLRRRRRLADLVEEERPLRGRGEQSRSCPSPRR